MRDRIRDHRITPWSEPEPLRRWTPRRMMKEIRSLLLWLWLLGPGPASDLKKKNITKSIIGQFRGVDSLPVSCGQEVDAIAQKKAAHDTGCPSHITWI